MTRASSAHTEPSDSRQALWRNRDYNLLWSGQAVSSIGTQASTLAFPLLLLALTHSPAQAGLASALRALPYVVFSLPAGALVDRWDRKRMMLVSDALRALALGSIPVALALGHLTTTQIYLVSLIEGSLYVFSTSRRRRRFRVSYRPSRYRRRPRRTRRPRRYPR